MGFKNCLPLALLSISAVCSAQVVLDSANGHYYELVTGTGQLSWTAASEQAAQRTYQNLPGHLAAINSADEEAFANNLGDLLFIWLGGTQAPGAQEPAGGWGWITGEPLTYLDWSPGEPNNDGQGQNENRMLYKNAGSSGHRQWMDIPDNGGNAIIHGYLVEYEPPIVAPQSFEVLVGHLQSGGLQQLTASDDDWLNVSNAAVSTPLVPPVQIVTTYTSPYFLPSSVDVRIESHASLAGLDVSLWLWNYNTNQWDLLQTDPVQTMDQTFDAVVSHPKPYVNPISRQIQAKFSYITTRTLPFVGWSVSADWAPCIFTP